MIKKSTDEARCRALEEAETSGRLVRYAPQLVGHERAARQLSLVPTVDSWLNGKAKTEALQKAKSAARTDFKIFVRGDLIDDRSFMKRSEPFSKGIWHFRTNFEPRFRFFGGFIIPDWFVVLKQVSRSLLGNDDRVWGRAIDGARTEWTKVFGDKAPLDGTSLDQFLTFNAEHCDDRW